MWSWCGIGWRRPVPARLILVLVLTVAMTGALGVGPAAASAAGGSDMSAAVVNADTASTELGDCECCSILCPQSTAVGAAAGGEYASLRPPIARPDDARRPTEWNARIDPPPPKPM